MEKQRISEGLGQQRISNEFDDVLYLICISLSVPNARGKVRKTRQRKHELMFLVLCEAGAGFNTFDFLIIINELFGSIEICS